MASSQSSSQFPKQTRICRQCNDNEDHFQMKLELFRENARQELRAAWDENTEKEERIAYLEQQLQDFIRREASYKQRINELLQQVRRKSSSEASGIRRRRFGRSIGMTSSSSLNEFSGPSSPPNSSPNGSGSARMLDSFLTNSTGRSRRRSSSESVTSASAWSLGSELRDLINGKISGTRSEQVTTHSLTQLRYQINDEMHEMTRQLESNDTLIRNLEQAIRKHVKSIVALQREQETTRQVATERERILEDKLKAGNETIARQIKDLQRYRVYVAELTDELDEPSSTIRVADVDAPLTRKVSSCTGTNKNACFLSPSMNGTRKTVAPFAA